VARTRTSLVFASWLVYALLWQSAVRAEQFTLEAPNFLSSASRQQTPVWCWAAVIQSLLNYSNISISQQEVVTSVKGPEGLAMPSTASTYEFQSALVGWRTTRGGKRYSMDFALYFPGGPPASVYQRVLADKRVVILGMGRQHLVVAYKGEFSRQSQGDPNCQLVSLTYFDPLDGQSKTVKPGTPEFKSISDAWVGWAAESRRRVM